MCKQICLRCNSVPERKMYLATGRTIRQYAEEPADFQLRSYYGGSYGAATSPAYYPAFDPLSVLASLAFLAFLLQSVASFFDRSRSTIMPATLAPGRSSEFDRLAITRRVTRALERYETRKRKYFPNIESTERR